MSVQQTIEDKIRDSIEIEFLEVVNESDQHNVPAGSESHFKLTVVSPAFNDKNLVAQHRMINAVLKDELAGPVHALALHTYRPEEWQQRQGTSPQSPPCLGGKAGS
jgi:BolA protein